VSNAADYFSIDAVNWSTLKHMRESALLYRYRLSVPQQDTEPMALGRATHTLVFEPEKFAAEYVIWQGGRRAGKEWEAFAAANVDKTILREQDADMVTALAEAISRHPLVQPYLDGGEFEKPIMWNDPETGISCKAKPDWLLPKRRILLDLKTCICAVGRRFGAVAARLGYHCQMAHYSAGIKAALGWTPQRVLIVAAEKDGPHDVSVFELDKEALYFGEEEVRELLRKVKVCRQANTWPGRYLEEQALQLPAWMFTEDEEDPESFGLSVG
jgi:hypothetical protein